MGIRSHVTVGLYKNCMSIGSMRFGMSRVGWNRFCWVLGDFQYRIQGRYRRRGWSDAECTQDKWRNYVHCSVIGMPFLFEVLNLFFPEVVEHLHWYLYPKQQQILLFGKPSVFELFQSRCWMTISQSCKIKLTIYWFKMRKLKDVDTCNSNSKSCYDLREQLFTLGEINMEFQLDSKRNQWSGWGVK